MVQLGVDTSNAFEDPEPDAKSELPGRLHHHDDLGEHCPVGLTEPATRDTNREEG